MMIHYPKWALMALMALLLMACGGEEANYADYEVVPRPQRVQETGGAPFRLSGATRVVYPEGDTLSERSAAFLSASIRELTGLSLSTSTEGDRGIVLEVEADESRPEGYRITVDARRIHVVGYSPAGLFYGCQTLRKAIPIGRGPVLFPAGTIEDAPRFAYRGMHLDVGRHLFPVDFIKKYIDILALHNLNVFHWHLTDDQGWRVEIKRYPKLTEVGAFRKESLTDGKLDGTPYGGFYTQEEIREVVAYASERFVEVIPEIDLPGHTSAVLASYPELGCTGGPYEVPAEYGVHKDVLCIGNPETIEFVKNVLAEIIDLFPSRFIHVGGDECPRDRWEECPKCQALVRRQGWKDGVEYPKEAQLQSYFMREVEAFVASRGRKVIGWDEILEGGVDPEVTVMAWRGAEKGVDAAGKGHEVIMTPAGTLYFSAGNLLNLGGDRGLRHVYEFEPAPDTLEADVRARIIGSQACLWTERVLDSERAEYMILPRLAALSEVVWSAPERKDFAHFMDRLYRLCAYYDHYGYTYSKHAHQITERVEADTVAGCSRVQLSTIGHRPIYYTTDGTRPDTTSSRYTGPIEIRQSTPLRAQVIAGSDTSQLYSEDIRVNEATFKPARLAYPPHENYTFQGVTTLFDGLRGDRNYNTGRWLGFFDRDLDVTIDLREPTRVSSVTVSTNVSKGAAVMGATGLEVYCSDDGAEFRRVAQKAIPILGPDDEDGLYEHSVRFPERMTRFVRVVARKTPELPAWHQWPHTPAFLFVDEVIVDNP